MGHIHTHTESQRFTELQFTELYKLAKHQTSSPNMQALRKIGIDALIAGLNSVLPLSMMQNNVSITNRAIHFGCEEILLSKISGVVIVGGGKATAQMCQGLLQIIGDKIPITGIINIPKGQKVPNRILTPSGKWGVDVHFASHPVPDEDGIRGVQKMFEVIDASPTDSLIIALISGGGSALMPAPADGITLAEKQNVNKLLLKCGASIDEINTVRKHLSKFKGGQLATYAFPRRIVSLILSDVIGNDLQTIASGPTVPDLTTFDKAIKICRKYQIFDQLPLSVQKRLIDGNDGKIAETPKPNPKTFETTTNLIIGSAETSAEAAQQTLLTQSIPCECYSNTLAGEAREYGKKLVDLIPKFKAEKFPAVFIGTGEFTVTIKGKGKGGRNQEMLLGFLNELQNDPSHPTNNIDFTIISGAFDGIEGNSPAMGAIIDSETIQNAKLRHLEIESFLENNDSFSFFDTLGDALITGQTGTNVNDMTIIVVNRAK